MSAPLLRVRGLTVRFAEGVEALRGVELALEPGESVAIMGESGAGKSTLVRCLAGLIQPPEAGGSVRLNGEELLGCAAGRLRELRWSTVAVTPQTAAFNPVIRVGIQVVEPLRERAGIGEEEAGARAEELAREVGLDPQLLGRFPHQLSGGQARLALLAMALCLDPQLIVLDEPTAGLDPTARRTLIEAVNGLARNRGFALLLVSHNPSVVIELADRAALLYAGEVIEAGDTRAVIDRPAHPYGWALAHSYPVLTTTKDLRPIRGSPPDPRAVPGGCAFHPRCTQAEDVCETTHPELAPSGARLVRCHFGGLKVLLDATKLRKDFRAEGRTVRALDGVAISIRHGEAVGLIGPSGSGKTTLARILAGHLAPDSGEVAMDGAEVPSSWRRSDRLLRRRIQLVTQDPSEALSPRLSVEELVGEPFTVAPEAGTGPANARAAVADVLGAVGLPASGPFLSARAHELSGGQLQRVAFARALITKPRLLVADEPTSMLDASEQARLLVLLRELQVEMGLGLLLVSHELAVVRKVTDRIVVLDRGRVVEEGPSEVVSSAPSSAVACDLAGASGEASVPGAPAGGEGP